MSFRFELNGTFNFAEWPEGSKTVRLYSNENRMVDKFTLGYIPNRQDVQREILARKWGKDIVSVWQQIGD